MHHRLWILVFISLINEVCSKAEDDDKGIANGGGAGGNWGITGGGGAGGNGDTEITGGGGSVSFFSR